MQQPIHEGEPINEEFGLLDVFNFIIGAWKILLVGLATGVLGGLVYVVFAPKQYEASALLGMPSVSISLNSQNVALGNSIEMPALLAERLKRQSAYSPEVIKVCVRDHSDASDAAVERSLQAKVVKDVGAVLELSAFLDAPESAKGCLESVVAMIQSQHTEMLKPYRNELRASLSRLKVRLRDVQDVASKLDGSGWSQATYLAKRQDEMYLLLQIDEHERALERDLQTRLLTPVAVTSAPVSPKPTLALGLGAMMGLIIGLILALLRGVFALRTQRALSSSVDLQG